MELQGSRQATGRRFALVVSSFNKDISDGLLRGARAALADAGVHTADVTVVYVPGAFEIPLAAKTHAATGRYDAVVCIGSVIRGETAHFEYVAGQCAQGIQAAGLDTGVPGPCRPSLTSAEPDRCSPPGPHRPD